MKIAEAKSSAASVLRQLRGPTVWRVVICNLVRVKRSDICSEKVPGYGSAVEEKIRIFFNPLPFPLPCVLAPVGVELIIK